MILLNDHVAEEDLKVFRHIKEITAKVRSVSIFTRKASLLLFLVL